MSPGAGKRRGLLALCLAGSALFAALGVWQLERLAWKRALIARVDARLQATPEDVPARADWATLDAAAAEYTRVRVRGRYLPERDTRVDALTELGPGVWLLTPMVTAEGTILVNRGFIGKGSPEPSRADDVEPPGEVTVTGLLRASEPDGRILRPNEPAANRWFSRDVAAIASARGLTEVAPFFVDADAASESGVPRGGLTVVRFRNAHLAYALTWFALAGLCVTGLVVIRRHARTPDV